MSRAGSGNPVTTAARTRSGVPCASAIGTYATPSVTTSAGSRSGTGRRRGTTPGRTATATPPISAPAPLAATSTAPAGAARRLAVRGRHDGQPPDRGTDDDQQAVVGQQHGLAQRTRPVPAGAGTPRHPHDAAQREPGGAGEEQDDGEARAHPPGTARRRGPRRAGGKMSRGGIEGVDRSRSPAGTTKATARAAPVPAAVLAPASTAATGAACAGGRRRRRCRARTRRPTRRQRGGTVEGAPSGALRKRPAHDRARRRAPARRISHRVAAPRKQPRHPCRAPRRRTRAGMTSTNSRAGHRAHSSRTNGLARRRAARPPGRRVRAPPRRRGAGPSSSAGDVLRSVMTERTCSLRNRDGWTRSADRRGPAAVVVALRDVDLRPAAGASRPRRTAGAPSSSRAAT